MRIFVINPGSTSTKVALFRGEEVRAQVSLPVPRVDGGLWTEYQPRLASILEWMAGAAISPGDLNGVVGRGGLLRPLEGGIYRVTEAMLRDAREGVQGVHASNLGCALARGVADRAGEAQGAEVPAFIVDPVSTDEFIPQARYSGLARIPRKSLSHALSIHALVRQVCRKRGVPVEGTSFVVAHLGGGISICPVRNGKILDANNANSGGPFSPSRAGGLPTQELLELAFSGEFDHGSLKGMTLKAGGLMSYLGTNDAREVESRIRDSDAEAEGAFRAMAYQISKEIGAMVTVLRGQVDAILLTGGLASSALLMEWVRESVEFLGTVEVWPQVEEMRALAQGCLRALTGEEEARDY